MISHLFVYGTLLPGDVRFHLLEPFIVDGGWPDRIAGQLFDTGEDYPAAIIERAPSASPTMSSPPPAAASSMIVGNTFALLETSLTRALDVLDEVEGVVDGDYRRVPVTTESGVRAWVYEGGGGLPLTLIPGGDWLAHRPPSRARPLRPTD